MASRTIRCFKTLSRLLLSSSKSHLHNLKSPPPPPLLHSFFSTQLQNPTPSNLLLLPHIRHFTSHDSEDEEEGETDDDDEEEEEEEDGLITKADINRTYSLEEMKEEAAAIGYKVIGPLDPTERPFKYREPFFAVIQIGSHQFKVSNGDTIYTEKLKFCEVNDKLILDKVLMVGSKSQTIIGRPILPDAAVHAVVEEHVRQLFFFRLCIATSLLEPIKF
ncbi:hypothetical protein IFM89_013110 [Coptis chinensis]|uniref:Large ribosomal subunit protein bL21m n=1 Tax=Coptis chinensis TaxID=261450 RepID=A0A835IPK7_9MAGN|nr:hypothetical protein IFM89_013110 [Coptis chinensis]